MAMGFRIHLTNFGYCAQDTYPTVAEAVAAGKKGGYEFSVLAPNSDVIAAWSVFGGTKYYT